MKKTVFTLIALLTAGASGAHIGSAEAADKATGTEKAAADKGKAKPSNASPTKVDPQKFKQTASGLKYAVLHEGAGKEARSGEIVTVHYTGWLQSTGEKFDSSVDRDEAFYFQLGAGKVIKGWDEGVQGMKVGEKRQLVIPPELGYGARGAGAKIPPNSSLVFDVELLRVDKE